MDEHFRKTIEWAERGGQLNTEFEAKKQIKHDISSQGFYDTNGEIKIFKPGEWVTMTTIKRFKLPDKLFIHSDSMRIKGAFEFAAKKKQNFSVGIIRMHQGRGDTIISTVIAKALKYRYGKRVQVWFAVCPENADILKHNGFIDKVFTSKEDLLKAKPDVQYNINNLELRAEIQQFEREQKITKNRTSIFLDQIELFLENKTPSYKVLRNEKEWAIQYLRKYFSSDDKRSIIGIQYEASDKSKTYPYIKEVIQLLKPKYRIFRLDSKDSQGKYVYTIRQLCALVNEMDLCITPDSFCYHIAGALKKRAVVLFGNVDGKIWTEDYEKVTPLEAACPHGIAKCWWKLSCLKGKNYEEKRYAEVPLCLSNITPNAVVAKVEEHFTKPKKVLLLILTYNLLKLTKMTIDSMRSFHNCDIFVVDNESDDGTVEWLKRNNIQFVSKKSSVCQALNIGLRKALDGNYDYVMLCNNDVVFESNYIDATVETAERRQCFGVVGRVINKGQKELNIPAALKGAEAPIVLMEAGDFSALLLSRKCLKTVGKFDEAFYPRYQEDEDYLLRIRLADNTCIKTYKTSFLHLLGQVVKTMKKEMIYQQLDWNRNVRTFAKKWSIDPYKQRKELHNLELIKSKRPNWKEKILIPIGHRAEMKKYERHNTAKGIIEAAINERGKANVLILRRMGGAGDILICSVIAQAMKKQHGKNAVIHYAIPEVFKSVLRENPYIDSVLDSKAYQHIDEDKGDYDFIIDITDYEYIEEMKQCEKTGAIQKTRAEIYLDLLGYDTVQPEFHLAEHEKMWAEDKWDVKKNKRIAMNSVGSNRLKIWPKMNTLRDKLFEMGYKVIRVDEKVGEKFKYNFRQMAALIGTASLTISPDTFASNLAAAMDIPAVTIFSHRNGKVFERMFKTLVAVQGSCKKFPDKNCCDYFMPCVKGALRQFRRKENTGIPSCFHNLSLEKVLNECKKWIK